MRTVVLGAGIVGMSTAYFLGKEGDEVIVLDAADDVAVKASAVNAGLIAPGHSFAWASPKAPKMLFSSVFGKNTAIRLKLSSDPRLYTWGLRFLRECTANRAERNTKVKLRLCQYSQTVIDGVAAEEGFNYHQTGKGLLYVYRDAAELEAGFKKMKLLQDGGQKQSLLSLKELAVVEPVFGHLEGVVAGAIHDVTDGSGDANLYAQELFRIATERYGLKTRLGVRVKRLEADGGKVTSVITTDGERITADRFVIALGAWSHQISKTVGVSLPVYPAKGYSATFPVLDPSRTPEVGGVDEGSLVAWCRMGDRLRMSSTAEFSGYDESVSKDNFKNILAVAKEWFPGAADYERGTFTSGLRPMTPDGPPVIGRSPKHSNLWFNTGQGHMGWTMGPGSGRIAVDLMQGKEPAIDTRGMEYRN